MLETLFVIFVGLILILGIALVIYCIVVSGVLIAHELTSIIIQLIEKIKG